MSGFPAPHDLTPTDDALRERLGDLAATVPHAPDRVERVTMRARRRRRHQVALRSGAAMACAAAVVGGLVFVRSTQPSGDGAVGAAAATTSTAATTATTEAPTAAVDCPDLPAPLPGLAAEAGTKARDAATAGDAGAVTQLKTIGTVTAVDEASLTVSADDALPDGSTTITAAITDATVFYDNGTTLPARPALAVGDRVVVGVETRDGGAPTLEFVSLHADDPGPVKVGDDEVVKGVDGSVSIRVGGGTGIDANGTTGAVVVGGGGGISGAVDGTVTCVAAGGASVRVGADGVVVETKG